MKDRKATNPHTPVTVDLVIEPSNGAVQGWGQMPAALQRRRRFREIGHLRNGGNHFSERVRRKWHDWTERLALSIHPHIHPNRLLHFLWGDDVFRHFPPHRNIVATLHQPMEKWPTELIPWCRVIGGVHALTDRERTFLESQGVFARTIPHPIDTTFWSPPSPGAPQASPPIVVYTGKYMRNLPMFFRVIRQVLGSRPDVRVEMLFNPDFRLPEQFSPLPDNIRIVGPFSADELREFLRRATVMFMPYDNVTASNSICEALACGLPIVTTRVGGMETYSRGGVVLTENNDDTRAIGEILRILDDHSLRNDLSRAARRNALEVLDANRVAAQLDEFYSAVAGRAAIRPEQLKS